MALGYVAAAQELREQLPDVGTVVVADGSGGTHAGLVAGLGDHGRVLGMDVGTRSHLAERVTERAAAAATLAGLPAPSGSVQLDRDRFGAGYGHPTPAGREALDLAARLEGLLLDPVYTGKAMAGLVAGVREVRIDTTSPIVFLHTGGLPALFADGFARWSRRARASADPVTTAPPAPRGPDLRARAPSRTTPRCSGLGVAAIEPRSRRARIALAVGTARDGTRCQSPAA